MSILQIIVQRIARTGLLSAGAAITLASSAHAANTTTKVAILRGGQEVPPNSSTARGCGRFVIDTNANTLSYYITYGGLSSAETAAHIHGPAGPGVNGGVIHLLPSGSPKVGVWTYPEAMEGDILAGKTYVNVHTTMFPGGEIRGQITDFVAVLDGQQENPPVPGFSQGWALANIDTCTNSFEYYIVVESLGAAEIAAHIHGLALPTVNAGVLHTLPPGSIKTGVWTYPDASEQAILDGQLYVNVHTTAFPGGEIRGQLVRTVVPIDGTQEVPPTPSQGHGCALLAYDQAANQLGYYILFGALTSNETAAHFHGYTPPGGNAGVVFGLAVGSPKKGIWAYPAANETNIFAGLTYINIHTVNFPGGEIRGQVLFPPGKCLGDVTCDGNVDVTDLLLVINSWGACAPTVCPADTNYDGQVNVADLLGVINTWGKCP